jgi:hypothetical protein
MSRFLVGDQQEKLITPTTPLSSSWRTASVSSDFTSSPQWKLQANKDTNSIRSIGKDPVMHVAKDSLSILIAVDDAAWSICLSVHTFLNPLLMLFNVDHLNVLIVILFLLCFHGRPFIWELDACIETAVIVIILNKINCATINQLLGDPQPPQLELILVDLSKLLIN